LPRSIFIAVSRFDDCERSFWHCTTMPVKPGDHVVFPASAGVWVEVEEERLLVWRVGQILGVLEEAGDLPDDALQAFEDEA
jgi:co-chaperonin GroES (HSP10)